MAVGFVLHFDADSPEAACASGFRVFDTVPECEQVEISGEGYLVQIRALVGD